MSAGDETRRLLKAFRRIAHALDIQSRLISRTVGLTLPQLVVLSCVRDLGEVTGRAISREADLSPATVVGILDKLEEKGLIERYRSTKDRRIVHTRITPAGTAALQAAPSPLGERLEKAFLSLEDMRRQQILDAFHQIAQFASSENDVRLTESNWLEEIPVEVPEVDTAQEPHSPNARGMA